MGEGMLKYVKLHSIFLANFVMVFHGSAHPKLGFVCTGDAEHHPARR